MKEPPRIPLLLPFWCIYFIIHGICRVPFWLVGCWWCDSCDKRQRMKAPRHIVGFGATICRNCHKEMWNYK